MSQPQSRFRQHFFVGFVQAFNQIGDRAAGHCAERFGDLPQNTARRTRRVFFVQRAQSREQRCDFVGKVYLQPPRQFGFDLFNQRGIQRFVRRNGNRGMQRIAPFDGFGDDLPFPQDCRVVFQRKFFVGGGGYCRGARLKFRAQRFFRGVHQNAVGVFAFARNRLKAQSFQLSDILSFNNDVSVFVDFRYQFNLCFHAFYQNRSPLVHEPLSQLLMQSVGKPVLDGAGFVLPERGLPDPSFALSNIRPNSDSCNTSRDDINVAVRIVQPRHLLGEPVLRQATVRQYSPINLR